MKYFPLVWAALWRKRGRTWLTGLSIFVAFFLYSLLGAVNAAFNMGEQISAVDRLVTTGDALMVESLCLMALVCGVLLVSHSLTLPVAAPSPAEPRELVSSASAR